MALRLSRAINTESKKLRSLLTEYDTTVSPEEQLSWENVTNLSSSIWLAPHVEDNLAVPRSVRLAAIEALMKKKRAIEEQGLLKLEMENVLVFHIQQHGSLANTILKLQNTPSMFNRGAVCLLKTRQMHYETEIKACIRSFTNLVYIPEFQFSLEYAEGSESDSEQHEDYSRMVDNVCDIEDLSGLSDSSENGKLGTCTQTLAHTHTHIRRQ